MTRLESRARAAIRAWNAYLEDEAAFDRLGEAMVKLARTVRGAPASGPELAAERLAKRVRVTALAASWGVSSAYVSKLERAPEVTAETEAEYLDALTRTVSARTGVVSLEEALR